MWLSQYFQQQILVQKWLVLPDNRIMVYLAMALIFLGLVFLGLYFYLLRVERPLEPQAEFPASRQDSKDSPQDNHKEPLSKKASSRSKGFSKNKKEMEESGRLPLSARIPSPLLSLHDFSASAKALSQREGPKDKKPKHKTGDPWKKNRKKKKAVELSGFFYLDHSRKYLAFSQSEGDIPLSFFDNIKRMGEGRLYARPNAFEIECGEASWKYRVENLDQMLFQKNGLALVTIDSSRPLAIFLTEEAGRLRDFVKKHSYRRPHASL